MSDWRAHLLNLFEGDQEAVDHFPQDILRSQSLTLSSFLAEKAIPAFEEFKAELSKYNRVVSIMRDKNAITIDIRYRDVLELEYSIAFITKMAQLIPQVNIRYLEEGVPVRQTIKKPFGDLDPDNLLDDIQKKQILSHLSALYILHSSED